MVLAADWKEESPSSWGEEQPAVTWLRPLARSKVMALSLVARSEASGERSRPGGPRRSGASQVSDID
jgi:hypothetical protein